MIRRLTFLLGALCVIAAISLFRLHVIDSQYAAVALHDAPAAPAADASTSTAPAQIALFPRLAAPAAPAAPSSGSQLPAAEPAAAAKPAEEAAAPAVPPPPSNTDFSDINPRTRAALVNIVCTAPGSEGPVSGSGVIIDPRGVILTNAHVAQYVLLAESDRVTLSCEARIGSPAHDAYHIAVLYLSRQWIASHAAQIREESPLGTGENDYALLSITGSATMTPLPETFPYVSPDTSETAQQEGQPVLIASYPAGFLKGMTTVYDLDLVSTVTAIKRLYTFSDAHTADLISLGGVIVAQGGSSGGAVVDGLGRLIAIIATSSEEGQTADRDLRAVTLYHINQSILSETGSDLEGYLAGDLSATRSRFDAGIAPGLLQQLFNGLMGTAAASTTAAQD
ncbi:MAG TPA: serine protease [Candidatus Paceibacterota bacterium]|nr:serine protease [Candidatus Paceibacterota bacterium]